MTHTSKPMVVMPNAGYPREVEGRMPLPLQPRIFHRIRQNA